MEAINHGGRFDCVDDVVNLLSSAVPAGSPEDHDPAPSHYREAAMWATRIIDEFGLVPMGQSRVGDAGEFSFGVIKKRSNLKGLRRRKESVEQNPANLSRRC